MGRLLYRAVEDVFVVLGISDRGLGVSSFVVEVIEMGEGSR